MKKIWGWIVGVVLVVALGIYIIWNGSSAAAPMNTNNDGGSTGMDGNGTTTMPADMPGMNMSSTASGTASTGSTTGYKDGTYTGATEDAVYGQLQVVVTIQGGKIISTNCPIQPNAPGHTSQVSASALPQLKQEAIASQSANIAVVSGATQDSQAFQASLASALAMAQN